MNTAKRVAGILILLVHVIGGFMVGRVFCDFVFRQSLGTLTPYGYDSGPRATLSHPSGFSRHRGCVVTPDLWLRCFIFWDGGFHESRSTLTVAASDALCFAVHSGPCREYRL